MEKLRFLTSQSAGPLNGEAAVPGDKSLSHRALIFGALSTGRTNIHGLLESDDVLATAAAMDALGSHVSRSSDGDWVVIGNGVGGFRQPTSAIDCGNSGTAARLLMGAVATTSLTVTFTGDHSLSKRPMGRVLKPLRQMGVQATSDTGDTLPLTLTGTGQGVPIEYRLPVASAQVKSAILLAALSTPGKTTVIEPHGTRDHTERMLRLFGAEVSVEESSNEGRKITVTGLPELRGRPIHIPGDPSSAAFLVVAALIVPGSDIMVNNVLMNEHRTGIYEVLVEMGADLTFTNRRDQDGEPVADIRVRHSQLKGLHVHAERAPSMIDEYPVFAVAAAHAEGKTVMDGLAELRVKESDRLKAIADGLTRCGVSTQEGEDSLTVHGVGESDKTVPGGAHVESHSDHRIAMSFLVLGCTADKPITVDGADMIATSFPNFVDLMNGLGADFAGDTA